jgi:hypothetical protein
LASDSDKVVEECGIVLLAFLDAVSNHFGPGARSRHGRLSGHIFKNEEFYRRILAAGMPEPAFSPSWLRAYVSSEAAHGWLNEVKRGSKLPGESEPGQGFVQRLWNNKERLVMRNGCEIRRGERA